jgi:hypothetical protein
MDFLSNILPSDHSVWFPVAFMGCLALGVIAGALIGHALRLVPVFMHFGVRALLTVVGIGATIAIAVPAFAAMNSVAVVPAAMLLVFTIAVVCSLGDKRNQWDADQEKWVVSLGE